MHNLTFGLKHHVLWEEEQNALRHRLNQVCLLWNRRNLTNKLCPPLRSQPKKAALASSVPDNNTAVIPETVPVTSYTCSLNTCRVSACASTNRLPNYKTRPTEPVWRQDIIYGLSKAQSQSIIQFGTFWASEANSKTRLGVKARHPNQFQKERENLSFCSSTEGRKRMSYDSSSWLLTSIRPYISNPCAAG